MVRFLFTKLLEGLVTLFLVILVTFVLLRFLPGGPFQNPKVPPEVQQTLEAQYHLNEPLPIQFGVYLSHLIQGDLGPSLVSRARSVNDMVWDATGNSFKIGFPALILGTLLGIIFGTWAGLSAGSPRWRWLDELISLLGMASLSLPSFVYGGVLVLLFALTLKWLPATTLQSPLHYILPVITLALAPFAYALLLVRTTVQETQHQLYVLIKHSFGLSAFAVSVKHILRNSLIPLISIFGPLAAAIITGSFAVETIFAVPGLGKHFVMGVINRDYTLVMGITILYSVTLILLNTATDILYGWADPRLRKA